MTPECQELAVLRSVHAAGGLEPAEAARVVAHLERCPECRAADGQERELLDLVKLPEATPAEALAVADLAGRTLGALRRRERRFTWARRAAAAAGIVAVAAAVVAMLLLPAVANRPRLPASGPAAQVVATQAVSLTGVADWDEDDLDTFDSTAASSASSSRSSSARSSTSSSSASDVALAAYDAGFGE